MKAKKHKKNYNNGGVLPPAIRNMFPKQDPINYGGMLAETTVTAPKYEGPMIRRATKNELSPTNSNFSFMGVDKSGGLKALRGISKLFKMGKSGKSLKDHVIPFHKRASEAYAKKMKAPARANMKVSDDIFDRGTLIGKGGRGGLSTKDETMNAIANLQKDVSPVPFAYTHGSGASSLQGVINNKGLVPRGALNAGDLKGGEYLSAIQGAKGNPNVYLPDDFNAINNKNVSVANVMSPETGLNYAMSYGRATAKNPNNFPVVYGINPLSNTGGRISTGAAQLRGEASILGKVGMDEISNIFVPDANKKQVIDMLGDYSKQIYVGSLEDYANFAPYFRGQKPASVKSMLYKKGGKILSYKKRGKILSYKK